MSDRPSPNTDRPAVTFVLFAYNQEEHVREAIEGAFAQTYRPLEIILSDDCSTDRTFEIMQEMAAGYKGPHTVSARKNDSNLVTALHVQAALREAAGEYFIVAAGDDISVPTRTERTIPAFLADPEVYCVCSNLRSLGSGRVIVQSVPATPSELLDRSAFLKGAATAYRRDLLTRYPPISKTTIHEDEILTMRTLLLGRIALIEEDLVLYREEPALQKRDPRLFKTTQKQALNRINLCDQWKADIIECGRTDLLPKVDKYKNYQLLLIDILSNRYSAVFRRWPAVLGKKMVFYEVARLKFPWILALYLRLKRATQGRISR